MDWIDLTEDRDRWRAYVKAAMNLRVVENARNFLTRWEQVSLSRRSVLQAVSREVNKQVGFIIYKKYYGKARSQRPRGLMLPKNNDLTVRFIAPNHEFTDVSLWSSMTSQCDSPPQILLLHLSTKPFNCNFALSEKHGDVSRISSVSVSPKPV
jgi:hypothetical protein